MPSGTPEMIANINPGSPSSSPSEMVAIGPTTYFLADDGTHGTELWKSDGTPGGTVLVKDIFPGSTGSRPTGSNPGSFLTNVNGTLFFRANDGAHGTELWTSDGTVGGTVMVKDFIPGSGSSFPYGFTGMNGALIFTTDDGTHHYQLWKTDGSAAGTVMIKQFNNTNYWESPADFMEVNGALFFRANDGNGTKLWKTTGTAASTVLVTNNGPREPFDLTNVNGTLFFAGDPTTAGTELWKSDGTAAGTVLVKTLKRIDKLTDVNGVLFFEGNDGYYGYELWKSDGTAAGTVLVKDINPNPYGPGSPSYAIGSYPSSLTNVNGTLYFTADDRVSGIELWKSDGTVGGTTLVKDIYPGSTEVYHPGYYQYPYGYVPPWTSSSINSSSPGNLANVNGTLFFSATDGDHGAELWQSDGTVTGTALVADINPGTASSSPGKLTNGNGVLFFSANDGDHGNEPWKLEPDSTGPPAIAISDTAVTEGNTGMTAAQLTVRLSAPSGQPVTISYTTVAGTATAGTDFEATAGTLTFDPGETSKTFAVLVVGDRVGEPNETFVVRLSGPANGTIADGEGVVTIVDDEPRVRVGDVRAREGDAGQTPFAFTVTLSAASDAPVTVDWATADGTAAAGTDYQSAAGRVTFAAGETTRTIGVAVLGDTLFEPDEMFSVTLGNPSGALVADGLGVGTVENDDRVPPLVSVNDVSRKEGRNGTTLFVFTVTLSAPSGVPVTVRYATADGTARAGEDYEAAAGTLTFAPGETTKTVTIKVKGDRTGEADETFALNLSGATNAQILDGTGLGTILNDD